MGILKLAQALGPDRRIAFILEVILVLEYPRRSIIAHKLGGGTVGADPTLISEPQQRTCSFSVLGFRDKHTMARGHSPGLVASYRDCVVPEFCSDPGPRLPSTFYPKRFNNKTNLKTDHPESNECRRARTAQGGRGRALRTTKEGKVP